MLNQQGAPEDPPGNPKKARAVLSDRAKRIDRPWKDLTIDLQTQVVD
jgi:hypothetical protein